MQEKALIKRLLSLLKPHKGKISIAIVCMIMGSGLTSAQAYMIKPLLDEIFVNKDRWMLNILPFVLVMVFLLKGIFNYFSNSLLDTLGQGIIRDLRKKVFSHIHSLPISFFHTTPTGELISRVINDSTLIQMAVSRALAGVFKDLFQVFGLLSVVLYLNWKLALIALVFLPLAFIPVAHFGRKFRKLSTTNQQTVAQVSNILHETITGHKIVKAFGMERYEIKRFSDTVDRLFGVIVKDIKNNSLQGPIMELLGGLGITAIIWYGGHQVITGQSTPGIFFSFLTSIIMIYNPIKGVSNINSAVQQGLASATRVFTLLDTKSSIQDKPDAITLPPFQREIEFADVSFSYDGTTDVLKDINLKVKSGEVLALVGTSGGGKTTLVNLLPRFFDVSKGSIKIDGHDLRNLTMKSLRDQLAIVSQQTILFNDTVKNNIAYGDLSRSDEEIIAAAKAAHAYDFINELPDGFDTVVGESGSRLSGGQQQRISIARALLKNAPILILDEATSALDTESEREVQNALENLMKNRTTFVIAHRLSTIRNADRIIVIQDGGIVEEGDHQTLLAQKGAYQMLHDRQY
ncbi:MAG TPA: lipid A export permease/ATP-binding protein MsbA [Desulfobulbaceae bacterium]|nr:MAG: lipid A export permease/ATP-binding protein MsbA [Deltaproteobacteria bacterium RIFOXYD12_FULL_53_23]HCC55593.1 lipid A export permease/ATP-binding protein MsbA [Desulfobulbaceae bacterium]